MRMNKKKKILHREQLKQPRREPYSYDTKGSATFSPFVPQQRKGRRGGLSAGPL